MAEDNDGFLEDDDFEKLLNSFINDKFEEDSSSSQDVHAGAITPDDDEYDGEFDFDEDDDEDENETKLSAEGAQINSDMTDELPDELLASLKDAQLQMEEEKNQPTLGSDESELAQAFVNFYTSVNKLCVQKTEKEFVCDFKIDDLYPNYKPSVGRVLANDLANGWILLSKMFPNEIATFPLNSTDEEFLNFAEKQTNSDLQLAVISYVEIMIDMEGCELSYQAKLIRYQEKHIKKIMYEEYMARKERQRKFTQALAERNFPVNADKLISNYFRVAQKDVDGAYRALCINPAIYAPIDFGKIKPRWFGLVKVTPKDGIRINIEIGNFLKKLKV